MFKIHLVRHVDRQGWMYLDNVQADGMSLNWHLGWLIETDPVLHYSMLHDQNVTAAIL